MDYLCDTNLMWRRMGLFNPDQYKISNAINSLLADGNRVYITPQNLIEYHAFATRPVLSNGLGLTPTKANQVARKIEAAFSLLHETPDIYSNWRNLMEKYDVSGRPVHDARLVAVMLTYGITHILTRNGADFRRYKEITVVEI